MRSMFYGASSFNQDLSSWNVSKVNDMSYMFGRGGIHQVIPLVGRVYLTPIKTKYIRVGIAKGNQLVI